jgi:hypothetical protein
MPNYICHECGQRFPDEAAARAHMTAAHQAVEMVEQGRIYEQDGRQYLRNNDTGVELDMTRLWEDIRAGTVGTFEQYQAPGSSAYPKHKRKGNGARAGR